MGRKLDLGGSAAFWGGDRTMGPHLAQCGLGRDLHATAIPSFISIHPTVWP